METEYEIPVAGQLLTKLQVARALGISENTVSNWISQGKIRFFKINGRLVRIAESEVLRILASSMHLEGKNVRAR